MGFKFEHSNIKWQKGSYGLPEAVYKIKVPSVTSVISHCIPDPEWDEFIAKVGKEKADQIMTSAGQRGSATHVFIETFIETYSKTKDISEALKITQEESPILLQKDNIPIDKIEEGRKLFYKFYYSDYPQKYSDVLAMELPIYSPSLFYRGKLDIFYRDPILGLSVTDLKSSNGKIKKGSTKELKYFYQLGGYAQALEEMYQEKGLIINRSTILCIDKQNDVLQEIELIGGALTEYKEKFKELVKQYHIENNQEYLIK
jgi:hypothetical protein